VPDSAKTQAAFDLQQAHGLWLSRNTLAWAMPPDTRVRLHYSADANLAVTEQGVEGGASLVLQASGAVDGELARKFRHLSGMPTFRITGADLGKVPDILRQQFVLSARDTRGTLIAATGIQPAGVLDDIYYFDGSLGPDFHEDSGVLLPRLRLWAPTARLVRLHLFDHANTPVPARVLEMTRDADRGTWEIEGDPHWNRKYYLYEVTVYCRCSGRVECGLVTDPWSTSLSSDSQRSQIVHLEDTDLMPDGWQTLLKPPLKSPLDMAIYELHLRDFSIHDDSVPEPMRGKFGAFTQSASRGMHHLQQLAAAGLTHVHLLPVFDLSSIPEDPEKQMAVQEDLSQYPPDSPVQQERFEVVRRRDAFNWGYDPFHYNVPEGSYASHADGVSRILEFRQMVAALNRAGLRLVMDVVYNHTSDSLLGSYSVLDRIVPDYYHRLDSTGAIETSTCCANTATEHRMMEKLMLDSLRLWATAYRVDGFRFDLMGHHSRDNLLRARDMLHALTLEQDGVDGRSIYLYGEGWNFGEVANDARFDQASQANMGKGTGIGTFNDRLRDAVRGGSPFDTGTALVRHQGFINGLYTDPNSENSGSAGELAALLDSADRIRMGLAASLSGYEFHDGHGNLVRSAQLGGYTSQPQEVINYVEAHDNETLFDINQLKLPLGASPGDRLRVQNLGTSIVALAQGIPFFHAGQDMLRSKSGDKNSYDSGDWFNLLDFSYQDNGWGRGLPLETENRVNWPVIAPRLANPGLAVGPAEILAATAHFRELLRIRRDSDLFRLRTADEIRRQVTFHNTGPHQVPGLIVMGLRDSFSIQLVVLFNASRDEQRFTVAELVNRQFGLHPVQRLSVDPVVRRSSYSPADGCFCVPARTTAVFSAV